MLVKTFNACNAVHAFCCKIRQEKTVANNFEIQVDTSWFDHATKSICKFLFNFPSVTQIVTTNYRDVGCVSTLGNDCVVAYGEENG